MVKRTFRVKSQYPPMMIDCNKHDFFCTFIIWQSWLQCFAMDIFQHVLVLLWQRVRWHIFQYSGGLAGVYYLWSGRRLPKMKVPFSKKKPTKYVNELSSFYYNQAKGGVYTPETEAVEQ